MRKANVSRLMGERGWVRRRFEDAVEPRQHDVTSFFFDLRLILPPGMPAADVYRARIGVERRLHRTVRKHDRIVWCADGFFLLVATTDEARAGAAAERVHADLCAMLDGAGAVDGTLYEDTNPAPCFMPVDEDAVRRPFAATAARL
jgi:hypothetical protein